MTTLVRHRPPEDESSAASPGPHGPVTFEDTFRALLPRAKRVAYRILGNETQAEDAAAEAFARAHASWKKVGASTYRDAWILRVTANVAIDMTRRQRRFFSIGLSVAEHADERASAEIDLDAPILAAALATLPRRQREIVVLRYLEELPEAEVAGTLRVSIGTVKKEAFRARQTLRARLGDAFAD